MCDVPLILQNLKELSPRTRYKDSFSHHSVYTKSYAEIKLKIYFQRSTLIFSQNQTNQELEKEKSDIQQ